MSIKTTIGMMGMNPVENANLIGTPWHLSYRNLSCTAQLRSARKETLCTHTQRIVATSCILQKAKDEVAKAAVRRYSPSKGGKVAAKERVRARARAKESLERTRVITRVKGRRSKTLVVVPSTTPVTSASSLHDITNRNARNTTLSFQKPAMSAFVLNCRMRRLMSTICGKACVHTPSGNSSHGLPG